MVKYLAVIGLSLGMGLLAVAQPDWQCRNLDAEISCTAGECVTAGDHTPMDVHLSDDEISVCAYTGCWEGQLSGVLHSGQFKTYTGLDLPFSTQPDGEADISVTIDVENSVGTLIVPGLFAHPVTCERLNSSGAP